ncbi:MAG: hypothetical protein M1832_003548 [Thelocarpon impressellum]|nr:MAG: hypothetical protein M1832_003548 [Thelocarpon impressellum]
MPAAAYARAVVRAVLQRSPPKWVWQGHRAWIAWFLDVFFPRGIWDVVFPRMFGLRRLGAIVRAGKKGV